MNAESPVVAECRKLEAEMTEAEKQVAFLRAKALGWGGGPSPPAWIWRAIFAEIISQRKGDAA